MSSQMHYHKILLGVDNQRIVIPQGAHQEILAILHKGHNGMMKMHEVAKTQLWDDRRCG